MTDRLDIVVVGAGIGGLGAALGLSRAGHRVTLVERDDTPMPADIEGAFEWDRSGAPQVRHPHAFLGLARTILRDRAPDVLQALLDQGVHEVSLADTPILGQLSDEVRELLAADDDTKMLGCRRTTFEWVLRRSVLAEPNVTLRVGSGVRALRSSSTPVGGVPTVTGVELEDGSVLDADLVVAAAGRRGDVAKWLQPFGVTIEETVVDAGVVYLSRFYRSDSFSDFGFRGALQPGLSAGVIGADNGTFSITAIVNKDDRELRSFLADSDNYEAAIRLLPEVADVVAVDATPTHPVHTMTGLINRLRRFTDETGAPLTRGFVAVGDVHTCTNPAYGRGQSLALQQAYFVVDVLDEHADVHEAITAYEARCKERVEPWYHLSVMTDQVRGTRVEEMGRRAASGRQLALGGLDVGGIFEMMAYADAFPDVVAKALRVLNLVESPLALMMELPRIQAVISEAKAQSGGARRAVPNAMTPSRGRRVSREQILAAVG